MPRVVIPYGKKQLSFEVSDENLVDILGSNEVIFPDNEEMEIEKAINTPIGMGKLDSIIQSWMKIAIICDDITRPTPVHKVIPILLDKLNNIGVPDTQIAIIMALGSHRYMTDTEMIKKLGMQIIRRVGVFNSEFRDRERMVDLGLAPGGVRIWADKRAMEADIRIGVGSIVPHPAVGWSGGGKIIYPGITGEQTVASFHRQQGEIPWNMFGSENSPVRERMEQWVDMVGLHFIINMVCTAEGRIFKVVAGHYVKAHRIGVEYAKQLFGVKAKQRVDIAIVSSHPADSDFWQATKGYTSGDHLVKDGGTLILVSPCPEGVGPHPEFTALIGEDDIEHLMGIPMDQAKWDPLALPCAATLVRMRRRIRLSLVSEGISPQAAKEAKIDKFNRIEDALASALARYGPSATVSVMLTGAETLPLIATNAN